DRAAGQPGIDLAGQRRRNGVDARRERIVTTPLERVGGRVAGAWHLARVIEPARCDDHPVDAGGVDELTGGPDPDLAQTDDEDRAHAAGLTGSRGPAVRASHRRWSAGPGPCCARAPPRTPGRRSPRRATRAGRPSCGW